MNPVNTTPYKLPANATWLITGCSSGIGRALATHVSKQPGHRLIATARDISSLSYLDDTPSILKLTLDVTDPASVQKAFLEAAAWSKDPEGLHLDVVVNNAGYSLSGDTEAVTEKEMHDEMETNFFGTVRVTNHALPFMRQSNAHRGGVVFNISSVAGVCAFPGHSFYHASKWAVEGWTESVAREMHPDWHIHFCIIEPAAVKTNFEGHSKAHIRPHEAYSGHDMPARQLEKFVERGLASGVGMEPAQVAETIYKVASRNEKVPLRLPLSSTAFMLMEQNFKARLQLLEEVKELGSLDKHQPQFQLD